MDERQTFQWDIEDIVAAHRNLYLEHCVVMAVALMSQQSASPCEFTVECEGFRPSALGAETRFLLRVLWTEQTALKAQRVWQTEQPRSIVERAAVALAALLFAKLVPRGQMRVTRAGDRADYWLPRLQCALEVSGTARSREMPRRQREKIVRVLTRRLIRWSYHRQEVKSDASS